MVKHVIPKTLAEALACLDEGTFKVIAGGTDLMVQKRSPAGLAPNFTSDMIYVANLAELKRVYEDEDGIHIGAAVTLEALLEHELTPNVLKTIIGQIAAPGIRHMGTLAGNIANASPAGDTLVGLYVLDAMIKLERINGHRLVPIQAFIVGVRRTISEPREMITEIIIPKPKFSHTYYQKVGGRQADAISKVSFLGVAEIENDIVVDLRLAFGAVAPTVIRSSDFEKTLKNISVAELKADLPRIIEHYRSIIHPIDDQRSSAGYRNEVAVNLLRDMIEKIG
ncbi:MAG: FAD binding domain-containing protein [Bacilli bacterium]|jgi:CO/xanthine dehydrogenase FAD-binding subunit